MQHVKIISRLLFYIGRFLAGFYFLMFAHAAIALLTGWSLSFKENGKYFSVSFPFTNTVILNGDYNLTYILLEFLGPLFMYGLFFLLLSNVFKVFFQPKLFTENSIKHLKRFYLVNLIVPGIMVLLISMVEPTGMDGVAVIILHGVIAVFAFFIAAIFKQGLELQNEKDLFI